jgi:uncharacterized protein YidB (DUF937 family)
MSLWLWASISLPKEVMMGLFDEITKTMRTQILGGASQGGLMEQVLGLINNPETGGLGGLIETFKSKGLSDVISSWIGTGQNQPVSGEQIANALGDDKIREIAQKLGLSGADASSGLAELLPQLIDKLTPDGTVPEDGLLEQGLAILKGKIMRNT